MRRLRDTGRRLGRRHLGSGATRSSRRFWSLSAAALLAVVALMTVSGGAVGASTPSIQSDLADYNPGGTVTLTGSDWQYPGSDVHIFVNDDLGQLWSHNADTTVKSDGSISYTFQLPNF